MTLCNQSWNSSSKFICFSPSSNLQSSLSLYFVLWPSKKLQKYPKDSQISQSILLFFLNPAIIFNLRSFFCINRSGHKACFPSNFTSRFNLFVENNFPPFWQKKKWKFSASDHRNEKLIRWNYNFLWNLHVYIKFLSTCMFNVL